MKVFKTKKLVKKFHKKAIRKSQCTPSIAFKNLANIKLSIFIHFKSKFKKYLMIVAFILNYMITIKIHFSYLFLSSKDDNLNFNL
jgi:hypothetical protein